jgi:hypothetical protein
MNPSELPSTQATPVSPQPEFAGVDANIKSRFVGKIMIFVFVLLTLGTLLVLWLLETSARGAPNIQKETEQLIKEVKEEVSP